jgi:hypothetical protein
MDNTIKSPLELTYSSLDWQSQQIAEFSVIAKKDAKKSYKKKNVDKTTIILYLIIDSNCEVYHAPLRIVWSILSLLKGFVFSI